MNTQLYMAPLVALGLVMATTACTPTVKLEAPDKPIEINLNVKVQQEVRVKVEKELENDIMSNPELFGVPSTTSKKK